MRIAVIYLRVIKKSDPAYPVMKDYEESTARFVESYTRFKPPVPHDLVVGNCGSYKPDGLFDSLASDQITVLSRGYDTGSYQELNRVLLDYDLVVACNTHVHFHRADWLDALASAARFFGPGVYGATASYENHPHLRTPCIAYHPGILAEYPLRVTDRGQCCLFEHGPANFSLWSEGAGYPVMLVTGDRACWQRADWRKPPNIFRRGDQSNVLVRDRHTDLYAAAHTLQKADLERLADGK